MSQNDQSKKTQNSLNSSIFGHLYVILQCDIHFVFLTSLFEPTHLMMLLNFNNESTDLDVTL